MTMETIMEMIDRDNAPIEARKYGTIQNDNIEMINKGECNE